MTTLALSIREVSSLLMMLKLSFMIVIGLLYSGLYYKHLTIMNDDSSIVNKGSFKLIDDARVIIYDRNRFIIQATGVSCRMSSLSNGTSCFGNKLERFKNVYGGSMTRQVEISSVFFSN
jgi:hypothetical protein